MEFLTKPVQVDTGKVTINLRLLLNERQKNILIMVTDGEDTKRKTLTAYPYHYSNFSKEELYLHFLKYCLKRMNLSLLDIRI